MQPDRYSAVLSEIRQRPRCWLVTGAAGFIGSNLVSELLRNDQHVVGLDNFATGFEKNLEEIRTEVSPEQWGRFTFERGDICDLTVCHRVTKGCEYVLHQAALGSVPKSIEDPLTWNRVNVDGFLNVLIAARDAGVQGFVYASSSSVYGDSPALPKVEENIGEPLSPYAVSKYANELYAKVFQSCYGFSSVGLRYFNVFGRRQDPEGAYAAVIPRWISRMISGQACVINGDGKNSRDFCYIANVIQANILCAVIEEQDARNRVYNVGVGERTDLLMLHRVLSEAVGQATNQTILPHQFGPERVGDVKHSLASVDALKKLTGFVPTHTLRQGIDECIQWYIKNQ